MGDQVDAIQSAYTLKPVEFPDINMFAIGLAKTKSGHLGRWVEAMALLRAGDCDAARRASGLVDPRRSFLPHGREYWNDMGLIHEQCGEVARAGLYYAIAYLSAPYASLFPTEGFSRRPMVLGAPDETLPCYATRDGGYLSGSFLVYTADKVARCVATTADTSRQAGFDSALVALATCARKGLDTTTVLALRGRIRFARQEYRLAEEDLRAAHDKFARAGLTDPETNLRLGQILLQRKQQDIALRLLERAVEADSTRTELLDVYGAALLEAGRPRRGRAVLERTLALDRGRASVLYNLGLLDLKESRPAAGIAHLEEAQALAPQDQAIARLLRLALSDTSAAPPDLQTQGPYR